MTVKSSLGNSKNERDWPVRRAPTREQASLGLYRTVEQRHAARFVGIAEMGQAMPEPKIA